MKYVKEKLKGTCVLNESVEMGAEIVALYTEAGANNRYLMEGLDIDSYYGCDRNGDVDCTDEENTIFDKVLTLDQLREIVRGEKAPESFNNKCLIEAFSEVPNLTQPVEFKEGEMVDVYLEGTWCERKYAFFVSGEHWYYNLSINNTVHIADEIRKIDPDKELKETADEVMKGSHSYTMDMDRKWIDETDVKSMLIEAMKKVQSKK